MTTPTLDRVTERVPVKEPAKLWKGLWVSRSGSVSCRSCKSLHEVPKTGHLSCATYPSKEICDEISEAIYQQNLKNGGPDSPTLNRFVRSVPVDFA